MADPTFIIDCHTCKAKVAAIQKGRATRTVLNDEEGEFWGAAIAIGQCPSCNSLLVGEAEQTKFENWNAYYDGWGDFVRVYPKPPKTFLSQRIPKVARVSLIEADRSLQAGANIAACVMLGRAIEGICREMLQSPPDTQTQGVAEKPKKIMLAEGIRRMKDAGLIDDRLFDWSQHLAAFRNLAAHPEDIDILRQDVEDLQTFVYAIVEYIYDLTDRYNEFKLRVDKTGPAPLPSATAPKAIA